MAQRCTQQIEHSLATHAIVKLFPIKEALCLCEKMINGGMNADNAVLSVLDWYSFANSRRVLETAAMNSIIGWALNFLVLLTISGALLIYNLRST